MGNCLCASNEGNHAKDVQDFTKRIRKVVTPENLDMQFSQEPRTIFTKREFIYLFGRQNSIGVILKKYMPI